MLINQEIKKLYDILKKEQKAGFKNNTVFGGISLLSKRVEYLSQIQTDLSYALNELKNYNNLPLKQREQVVCDILLILEKFLSENEKSLTKDLNTNLNINQVFNEVSLNEIFIDETNLEKVSFLNTSLEKFSSSLGLNKRMFSILKKYEIKTLKDLLWFFPRSYSDRTKDVSLFQAVNQERAFLILEIISEYFTVSSGKKKLKIIKYLVSDSYGYKGELVFFNQDYIIYQLKKGKKIKVFARVIKNKTYQIVPEEWEYYEEKTLNFNRIVPHYSISVNPKKIRQIIYNALKIAYKYIDDPLIHILGNIQTGFVFKDLAKSIVNLHFPSGFEELNVSRNRVALEEIIYTQMLLSGFSKIKKSNYKIIKEESLKVISRINLPFELTEAQKKVISEIIDDFASDYPSRRLVQGDVGAGKTIVAFLACYITSSQGYQSCIMAPTEILASQHFNNFQKFFPNSNVKLLTSKIKGKQREKILFDLKEGNIDVLIGTHALIEENIEFKNLALIVIDEQHKFGVNQRFKLYSKSDCPHLIVMSATPIPRT
ncbi:MAG: DEAD/DEAH box helicase, partial [bacterium]